MLEFFAGVAILIFILIILAGLAIAYAVWRDNKKL